MRTLPAWIRLPSRWIAQSGLTAFTWKAGEGADNIVALMLLILIAHQADQGTGLAEITYDEMAERASCSRAKVARALRLLEARGIVKRKGQGRSSFELCNFDPLAGWAKVPAKRLYHNKVVSAFRHFKLRQRTELDALKVYLLLITFRDKETNYARISYVKITHYTGIAGNFITAALSLLATNSLISTQRVPSGESEYGVSHAYRIAGIDPYNHPGTQGAIPVEDDDFPT